MKPQRASRRKLLNQGELAKALGVSPATVTRWKSKGLPLSVAGKISIASAEAWRAIQKSQVGKHDGDALIPDEASVLSDDVEGKKALTQYRRAKAAREMIAVRELRGELVPIQEIDGLLVQRALEFRRGLEALENKLPARFPEVAAKLKEALHEEFRNLLLRYSRDDSLLKGERRPKRKNRR